LSNFVLLIREIIGLTNYRNLGHGLHEGNEKLGLHFYSAYLLFMESLCYTLMQLSEMLLTKSTWYQCDGVFDLENLFCPAV